MTEINSGSQVEKRFTKYTDLSSTSIKILNALQQRDTLEHGLSPRDCKIGRYVDSSLLLLAEKEGINID